MMCKLCGHQKTLVDAHIIPRSFHRIDPNGAGPPRLVTNAKGRYSQKIWKGVYDPAILCEDCERRFSGWDDYGHELLVKAWRSFERIKSGDAHIGYRLPSYDYSKLKLFITSVLWRASVSSHPMFSKISLGPRADALRQNILEADPGTIDHFGVLLQAFDDNNVGILDPHSERFSGLRFCRLYIAHIVAFVKVDSRPLDPTFRHLALAPNSPLLLAQKNFMNSPERQIMQNLIIADRRRRTGRALNKPSDI